MRIVAWKCKVKLIKYETCRKLLPEDFSKARNSDAIRFLLHLQLDYKMDLYNFVRQQAPKGIGANVCPIILDTGFCYDMQSPRATA